MNEEKIIEILKDINIVDFYNTYSEYTFPESEIKEKCNAVEAVVSLLEEKNRIIKDQSKTNKKLRNKLHGYRRLLKLKEKHLNILKDELIKKHYNI